MYIHFRKTSQRPGLCCFMPTEDKVFRFLYICLQIKKHFLLRGPLRFLKILIMTARTNTLVFSLFIPFCVSHTRWHYADIIQTAKSLHRYRERKYINLGNCHVIHVCFSITFICVFGFISCKK